MRKAWNYKALVWVFAVRDIKIKYSQTFIGVGWSILQPLVTLAVYVFFLGFLVGSNVSGIPYYLYVLSGLVCWNLFSYIVFQGSSSIQNVSGQIRKVYFPKLIVPLSKAVVAIVEFGIGSIILFGAMMYSGQPVSAKILLLPVPIMLTIMLALSIAIGVAALSSKYRDLGHLVPFAMGIGMWCTPVFFSKDLLPSELYFVWYLNPMASVMELWRFSLFPEFGFERDFIFGIILVLPMLFGTAWLFAKRDYQFAEEA